MTRRRKHLAADEKRQHGFGDFGVDDVENTFYTLPDGARLALRLFWTGLGLLWTGLGVCGDTLRETPYV